MSSLCHNECCFVTRLQTNLERDVYSRLTTLQEGLVPKKKAGANDDLHRINELIQVKATDYFYPHMFIFIQVIMCFISSVSISVYI